MTTTMGFTSRHPQPRSTRGFTLIELLVAMGLSSILLAAFISAMLFFTKSGLAMGDYYEMESQTRHLLEVFARDTREADNVTQLTATAVTLVLGSETVQYTYDSTARVIRRSDSALSGQPPRVLASGISACAFRAYDQNGSSIPLTGNPAPLTKMIQIDVRLQRDQLNQSTQQSITSSRFVLRNKPIPAP